MVLGVVSLAKGEILQTLRFRTRKTLTTTGNNLDVIDLMPRVGKALDTTQRIVLFMQ